MNRSVLALALVLGLTACSSQPETPIASAPVVKTVMPVVSGALGQTPVISKPEGPAPTSLQMSDLVLGSGAQVASTSTVTVQYLGLSWSDGKVFDSSWQRGQSASFGLDQVIAGWQQGLLGMKVGGRRLIVVPPDLGYGAAGTGAIKPNETLVFVVDLLAVK